MSEIATRPSAKGVDAGSSSTTPDVWRPFEALRRQVNHLFEDFDQNLFGYPLARGLFQAPAFQTPALEQRVRDWAAPPAVDIAENEKQYEITAELPGLSENDISVKAANGVLTLKGEKREQKEDKSKGYHLTERSYGFFSRTFQIPAGVDKDKITASFKNGLLTLTLPKSSEAQKQERSIAVKAE